MASLLDLVDPFEAAAAKVQRRYPTRPPDPASLAASQGGVSWEQFLPSNERALQSAASLQAGGDYNPRDVFLSALGAVGTPGTPAGALGSSAGKGIRAYHSSPHDFERFDLSKIGTGQGAQSYGHGIYVAENPAVSGQGGEYWNEFLRKFSGPEQRAELEAAQMLRNNNFDREMAINEAQGLVSHYGDKHSSDILKLLESNKPVGPRTYEVNIHAQPEQFLNWDKPLMEQPQRIIDPIADFAAANKIPIGNTATGQTVYNAIASRSAPRMDPLNVVGIDKPSATSTLRDAGIPGIKYLDQGSRLPDFAIQRELDKAKSGLVGAEMNGDPAWIAKSQAEVKKWEDMLKADRTSNYVLFRDDIISIIRKYGWAGLGLFGISPDDAKAAGVEKGQTNKLRIGSKTYGE